MIRVGTAGWTVPRRVADHFPSEGSGLQRYAARFNCAEINSTFYRPHKPATFARWAADTPDDFRFAAKAPKIITHEAKLKGAAPLFADFVRQLEPLGPKLGPILVQLPPSLAFDRETARAFFADAREAFDGAVVFEPRHPTWFDPEPEALLVEHRIARVAADPARAANAAEPGGWTQVRYWRLHGSPRLYYSEYERPVLDRLADALMSAPGEAWCIFDNTVSGAAALNALQLSDQLER